MAEQVYYVRKQNQISGPFTVAELRDLRVRSLFARFNEVSVDKVKWKPATSIAGLFPEPPPPPNHLTPPAESSPAIPFRTEVSPPPSPQPGRVAQTVCEQVQVLDTTAEWFYLDRDDVQQGPVSLQTLQQMLDAMQVDPATYACKPGMSQWVELQSMPELRLPGGAPPFPGATGQPTAGRTIGLLAVLAVPVVGLVLVALLGYAALDAFHHNNATEGVLYAFVGLVVFLLAGVASVLLAVAARRPPQ